MEKKESGIDDLLARLQVLMGHSQRKKTSKAARILGVTEADLVGKIAVAGKAIHLRIEGKFIVNTIEEEMDHPPANVTEFPLIVTLFQEGRFDELQAVFTNAIHIPTLDGELSRDYLSPGCKIRVGFNSREVHCIITKEAAEKIQALTGQKIITNANYTEVYWIQPGRVIQSDSICMFHVKLFRTSKKQGMDTGTTDQLGIDTYAWIIDDKEHQLPEAWQGLDLILGSGAMGSYNILEFGIGKDKRIDLEHFNNRRIARVG
nr:hypothetical protein [Candidatus Sigynarchaeota archaeon]